MVNEIGIEIWQEFEYNGKLYTYELDGYKPLGVEDENGEDLPFNTPEGDAIYDAAIMHAAKLISGELI
jgi:hypothetical protein